MGSIGELSTSLLNCSGLLGVMSRFWRYAGKFWTVSWCGNYTKGSAVRRECGAGNKSISAFPPSIPLSAHREGNLCPGFNPPPASPPVGGAHSNLIGQKLASLASRLNRGCYCISRRNGHVLLPPFASCIHSKQVFPTCSLNFSFTYHRAGALLHFLS